MQITATIEASDVCDETPTVTLMSVTSSEPGGKPGKGKGRGKGNKGPDIDANTGIDERVFHLRAQRDGKNKDGRTYTVVYRVEDSSGNATFETLTVHVPHDERDIQSAPRKQRRP